MKTKLYRAKIGKEGHRKNKLQSDLKVDIYVASESMIEAAKKLTEVLAVEEELLDIIEISEECYV